MHQRSHPLKLNQEKIDLSNLFGKTLFKTFKYTSEADLKDLDYALKGIPVSDELHHIEFTFFISDNKYYFRCKKCEIKHFKAIHDSKHKTDTFYVNVNVH